MYDQMVFIKLVHNAALLITLAYAYSLISVKENANTSFWVKTLLGVVVSAIGLSVMLTSWEMDPGIVLDTRSVLLSGAGLFLGFVPTVTAMIVTAAFHHWQGTPGTAPGLMIVIASGSLGLLWRHHRRHVLVDISWRELYLFGLIVHLLMVSSFVVLPWSFAAPVLRSVTIPILILFPFATMLFGRMMSYRLKRERDALLLAESEERYRTLFENNHTVMMITDLKGNRIVDANAAAESFYGWDRETLCGKTWDDLTVEATSQNEFTLLPSSDKALMPDVFFHRLADDQTRLVEVYSGPITIDGQSLRYAIIHDITDAKRMEEQLRQSQKMEAVGRLAGGVAHDYNNKLQTILGFTDLALKKSQGESKMISYLEEVRDAGLRSAQLTMQLMAYARKQPIQPTVQNVNETIARMLKMIKKLVGEDIDLEWKPAPDLWLVKTDASQMDQVLVNLALNARDAIADVGKLTIETQNAVMDPGCESMNQDSSPGDFVMIAVTDNGCGIKPGDMQHLFEPFYTTKSIGKGTGLGLATVYGVLRQNSGFIDVHSVPGEGTSFKLYMPRSMEEAAPQNRESDDLSVPAGGGETILLVEDEVQVLDLIRQTLVSFGYKVLDAESPEMAQTVALQYEGRIDLMISDVVMPGMNGRLLYESLLERRKDLKVLYISGYTANAIVHRGILDQGVCFLQKPFATRALCSQVREILDLNA